MSGRWGGFRPRPTPWPARPETIRTRANRQAHTRTTRVFVKGLRVSASIGVHPHEHETRQTILVDVALDLGALPGPRRDRLAETFDYQAVATHVASLAREGHVQLVETLAQRIAAWCLEDARVQSVSVRIEKPDALEGAHAAGCELVLYRQA